MAYVYRFVSECAHLVQMCRLLPLSTSVIVCLIYRSIVHKYIYGIVWQAEDVEAIHTHEARLNPPSAKNNQLSVVIH